MVLAFGVVDSESHVLFMRSMCVWLHDSLEDGCVALLRCIISKGTVPLRSMYSWVSHSAGSGRPGWSYRPLHKHGTVKTREPHQKYPSHVADDRFAGLRISSYPNANPKAVKNKGMYLSPGL
jgi:hypothetical protein